jgi:predicted outer membrane protein
MEKNKSIISIGILLVGIFVGYFIGSSNSNNFKMHNMPNGEVTHNNQSGESMQDMMHDMASSLEGKTGADFDKEFLIQMSIHHEGAVEMAEMVLQKSQNAELRAFAQDIIDAQTSEIKMMNNWLSADTSVSNTSPTVPKPASPRTQTPPTTQNPQNPIVCTMDAKMCPDGVTYVGRIAPNCAFAKCPGEI